MKAAFSKVRVTRQALIVGAAALTTGIALSTQQRQTSLSADSGAAIPAEHPWSHKGLWDSYDAASIRRGYKVYKDVCSACHGMSEIAFRNLDIAFTQNEIKYLASTVDVDADPDSEGEIHKRSAKSFDYFPDPYKNEQHARSSNAGALPPDLSIIVRARPHNEDYVFALLTGYDNPPPGVSIREGLYFNAYFPGGAIGMAPPLSDGSVDYDDGTPGTLSQYAKDVTTFLTYCARPEEEDRKKFGIKAMTGLAFLALIMWYNKRVKWSVIKNRRVEFRG